VDPNFLSLGDLDYDGLLEAVTSNWTSNDVSVLYGLPGGLFATEVHYPIGGTPCAVALADLNGDARLDIVTANADRDDVTILYSEACPSLFFRGDASASNAIDIADAIFTLSYLFAKGKVPDCLDAADANDDGKVNVADAIRTLSNLFAHTGPLPEPFGECGIDPTIDDLDCTEYVHCQP
jgi:hypothetical protein